MMLTVNKAKRWFLDWAGREGACTFWRVFMCSDGSMPKSVISISPTHYVGP